ncbi:hypothetical protein [Vibrio ishigakensis]|uniref:hypothetical protein n=1 Tax=Vibrio ishigakensis TaxID=1481914 RepID=UPI0021C27E67|nr:hypothetical protein [Vibrio ishigakensis]
MDSLQIAEHVVEQIKAGTQKGENLEKIVIQLLADDFKNLDWISASEIVLKEQGAFDE